MSVYDSLSENKLPTTREELYAEINAIDALTELRADVDAEYTFEKRYMLMQRRVLLGNMRRLFRRTIKGKKVEVRPFEVTQGISSEAMSTVTRIVEEIDKISGEDVEEMNNDANARALIFSILKNVFGEENQHPDA